MRMVCLTSLFSCVSNYMNLLKAFSVNVLILSQLNRFYLQRLLPCNQFFRVEQDYIFKIKCLTKFGGSTHNIEKMGCDEVYIRMESCDFVELAHMILHN